MHLLCHIAIACQVGAVLVNALQSGAQTLSRNNAHKARLQYHGTHTDMRSGLDFDLFTPLHLKASNTSAMQWHNSYNSTRHPTIGKRGLGWIRCKSWQDDWVGGEAGCHESHGFSADIPNLRLHLFELLVQTFTYSSQFRTVPRSRCVVLPPEGGSSSQQICVSWPEATIHGDGIDLAHIAKIVEFAVKCSEYLGLSSEFLTDDINAAWMWICISDRPQGCQGELCYYEIFEPGYLLGRHRCPKPVWVNKRNETERKTIQWLDKYVPRWQEKSYSNRTEVAKNEVASTCRCSIPVAAPTAKAA